MFKEGDLVYIDKVKLDIMYPEICKSDCSIKRAVDEKAVFTVRAPTGKAHELTIEIVEKLQCYPDRLYLYEKEVDILTKVQKMDNSGQFLLDL